MSPRIHHKGEELVARAVADGWYVRHGQRASTSLHLEDAIADAVGIEPGAAFALAAKLIEETLDEAAEPPAGDASGR